MGKQIKKSFKNFLVIAISLTVLLGCSLINKVKEELAEKTESVELTEEVEKTESSAMNLEYYNAYIGVLNKLSQSAENVQKSYLQNIPDPKTIKKGTFIIAIMADTYLGFLERDYKEQYRSLNDGGELSKLTASEEMQSTIEADFKELLKSIDDYMKTADKVISYYKDGDYKDDLSKAVPYDDEMKDAYKKYEDAYTKMMDDLDKFKPEREIKDPDDYSNPDEKSIVILENAYYSILDEADKYIEQFKKSPEKPDIPELRKRHDELEKVFGEQTAKVESAPFTDKSKYLKYNYEDYFSKMMTGLLDSSDEYMKKMEKGNLKDYEYNNTYDAVVRNYNNVINAYNSSINTLNSFVIY
jgi:hypothetical protein